MGKATATTNVSQVPSRSRSLEPPRLAVGKTHLIQDKGFTEEVAQRIVAPQAKSSGKGYDGKWNVYEKWCKEKEIDPNWPTIPQLAMFLQYVFDVLKLQYQTIAGYRSMLSSSLKHHTELNVGNNQELSSLLQSFKRERPPMRHIRPEWDISFVLWSLVKAPFEHVQNDKQVNDQFLTWKTAFLLLLASGARRGELHAVTYKGISFAKDHVTLKVTPEFVSKTGLRKGEALKPIVIPSLTAVLGEFEKEDRALCPVRCLKAYLDRTHGRREGKKLLLISMIPGFKGDIRKGTLSAWIKNLILYCYRSPAPFAMELTGSRAHEIRGIAHSLVFRGCVALEDLIVSGSWKSHTTFTDKYLKDLTELDDENLCRLGPIVAAQRICNV